MVNARFAGCKGLTSATTRGRSVVVASSVHNSTQTVVPRRRGRSWSRGSKRGSPNRPFTSLPESPRPLKLSEVILKLKADSPLPEGLSPPAYLEECLAPHSALQECERKACQQPSCDTVVAFRIHMSESHGEDVCVVGSCFELGAWSVDRAVRLQQVGGGLWAGSASLPAGSHEFKLVVRRPAAAGDTVWEPLAANRSLKLEASSRPLEYTSHWGEEPLPPRSPPPAPAAPPAHKPVTKLQRTYSACRDVLAMYGAGSVSSVDIGGNGWRSPAPSSAVTADTLFDMIEAARLSRGLAVVTCEDADFVRKLGLGACNLPAPQHLPSPPVDLRSKIRPHAVPADSSGSFPAAFSATADGHLAVAASGLARSPSAASPLSPASSLARSLPPARGAARNGVAAAAIGGRRRVISEATATAMQSMLGLDSPRQQAEALGANAPPQRQAAAERSSEQVAAQLLADHLGLGALDSERRAVVVDSFSALASRGFVPRHLGPVQYTSWLARNGSHADVWHAAVRCALAPLAELPQ